MHVAKTNFSVRFGLYAFRRRVSFARTKHCFRVNAKTGTDGLFGRNDQEKGSSGNDKIPLDRRPPNATTCGNSVLLRARLSMIMAARKSIVNDFRRILMI
jgi:hypothetical protein